MAVVADRQGIDLGSLISGGNAASLQPAPQTPQIPIPVAPGPQKAPPATSPRPVPRPTQAAAEPTDAKGKWATLLSDPRVKVGLLQLGVNLLAGQGAGQAIGGGLAAAGRATAQGKEAEMEQAKFELDQAKALAQLEGTLLRNAKLKSGGKGKSSSSAAKKASATLIKKYMKHMEDIVENSAGLGLEATETMSPIMQEFIATKAAEMEAKGVPLLKINAYVDAIVENPARIEVADEMADTLIRGPAPEEVEGTEE